MPGGYRGVLAALSVLSLAAPLAAQFASGPRMRGVWNPVVGSGSVYEMVGRDGNKNEMQIAIVGQESIDGKPGYWLEMAMKERNGQKMVMKQLTVLDGDNTRITRMIMQMGSQPPMEMPMQIVQQRGHVEEKADVRKEAELVGNETITTPAGAFSCEHYRTKQNPSDVWVSTKVAPYGLVKMTSEDSNMTLIKVITDAKSQITGTPKSFNPMQRPQ